MRVMSVLFFMFAIGSGGCADNSLPPPKPAANQEQPATVDKDNTAINARDKDATAKTPIDQNENRKDIDVTAAIRKRVVDIKLSVNAHNVKIITQDGKVTLRGPVKSAEERKQIEDIASEVAGAGNVESHLEIEKQP